MSIFGPSDEERHNAAARALSAYGFTMDAGYAQTLQQYEPLADIERPNKYVTAFFGTIEGARVEAYEYEYETTSTSSNGHNVHGQASATVVVVHHEAIRGGASFVADELAFSTAGKVTSALLWIPPFTIFKALMLLGDIHNRHLGDKEFEAHYKIHAASDEAAVTAIPPALRRACMQMSFKGKVELRPGLLIYTPGDSALDEQGAVHTIGIASGFLSALAPHAAQPTG